MQHPWKHSVIDVYANNYGSVMQDYLSLVVEPSIQMLRSRSSELMDSHEVDAFIKSIQMLEHCTLEQKTVMAFCLGTQSLWEQHIRTYTISCLREFHTSDVPEDQLAAELAKKIECAEKAPWGGRFNALFFEARGIELERFQSYDQLSLLMALGNVCRHGEGDAAKKLRKSHPELWPTPVPLLEEHFGTRPVTDLRLSLELLRSLVIAVVLFWRDLERHGLKSFMHDRTDAEIEPLLSNRVRAK
ncbi:hypothetical protein PS876_03979 [Pseudomonas fluorescens]|uniref:hypothetical protein n=1 Tax=Pseudomonas fluorescens TaxID=294 RepID=UPI001241ED0C|nr:hypothetical protein [Pseudomonas fluorescens]VVP24019.1 hypothetical protein PS876_03979 [Pseudomonas fluorescens]